MLSLLTYYYFSGIFINWKGQFPLRHASLCTGERAAIRNTTALWITISRCELEWNKSDSPHFQLQTAIHHSLQSSSFSRGFFSCRTSSSVSRVNENICDCIANTQREQRATLIEQRHEETKIASPTQIEMFMKNPLWRRRTFHDAFLNLSDITRRKLIKLLKNRSYATNFHVHYQ